MFLCCCELCFRWSGYRELGVGWIDVELLFVGVGYEFVGGVELYDDLGLDGVVVGVVVLV